MALVTSGYNEKSSKSFIIDSGTIYKNMTFDKLAQEFSGDLLGATADGVKIKIDTKKRKIKVDGTSHTNVKGLWVKESEEATISAKVKEITSGNLAMAMSGTEEVSDE